MSEVIVSAVLFCSLWEHMSCQTATDAVNLKTQLFTTKAYDYNIRPIIDQSQTIEVDVVFTLLGIISVDEKSETIKTTGYLSLYWTDQFLTWDPDDFGGIQHFFYPQDDVWTPDVALKNSYQDYKKLGHSSLRIRGRANGEVIWAPFQIFESMCSIDITYFPFDTQTCSLKFVAWSYTKNEVLMGGGHKGLDLGEYQRNSAWDIVDSKWFNLEENDEATIVFVFRIKRKPLYSVITLVFPVLLLAVLNLFVFALPCDSGEKASYAVTVFLAFAVFNTIMESSFPQNSETVAYFSLYVVAETIQSTLITIIALVMVRCSAFEESTRIPTFLLCLTRLKSCKLRASNNRITVDRSDIDKEEPFTDVEIKSNSHDQHSRDDDIRSEKRCTWRDIVNAFDIIFFVVFLLSFLVTTLVCLLSARNA